MNLFLYINLFFNFHLKSENNNSNNNSVKENDIKNNSVKENDIKNNSSLNEKTDSLEEDTQDCFSLFFLFFFIYIFFIIIGLFLYRLKNKQILKNFEENADLKE